LETFGEAALLAEGNNVVVKGLEVAVGNDCDSEGGVLAAGFGDAAGSGIADGAEEGNGLIWSDRVNPRNLWVCCCGCFRRFSRTERAAVGAVFSDD